jgi:hypothetical protein
MTVAWALTGGLQRARRSFRLCVHICELDGCIAILRAVGRSQAHGVQAVKQLEIKLFARQAVNSAD